MAGSRKKNKKVIKYRRPMNIGVVFFGFIAVYLIVCVYMFFNSTHISGYEVIAGNLAADYHYTGIALRTEQVFQSEKAGYISYYAREDEKVSVNSAVYTVDESGRMAQALKDSAGELSLSEEDYNQIRSEIAVYMSNASDMNFSEVYDFKTGINATILDLMNQNMIAQLDSAEESGGIFARYNAGTSGVVEYYVDGFENASLESLSSSWFDQEAYERTNLRTEELVGQGEPVYKLITEETWKLVFPLDEEMETYLLDKIRENQKTAEDGTVIQNTTYIKIRMDKDKEELWPSVTVEYREGKAYGVLDFVNSMIRYANDRFLTFEVLIEETRGLKIPKTAVTEKEFFVIDKNYVTTSGSNNNMGVMKQTVGEDGSSQAEFVNCTIYYQDEEYAYVDPKEENFSTSEKLLQSGDMLIRTDSAEYYQVGQTAKLKGVYNINKGYTVFRQI
ncbi:MAG: hypothetical protein HFI25_07280, partial [Lachnospiraceae bacterium]|nr:hypothetical protein [Lachnospiraceae bacterium]